MHFYDAPEDMLEPRSTRENQPGPCSRGGVVSRRQDAFAQAVDTTAWREVFTQSPIPTSVQQMFLDPQAYLFLYLFTFIFIIFIF